MAASGKHPITMSNASVPVVHEVEIIDELGRRKPTFIPGERSLTIYLDKREVDQPQRPWYWVICATSV
ncbi:MAG: hypothetical protein RLZZ149_360 [Pseudomonadota bacterium]